MGHTIEITIAPGGEATIKVKGVAGKGCHELTKDLERTLGTVTADVETPEAHLTPTATVSRGAK